MMGPLIEKTTKEIDRILTAYAGEIDPSYNLRMSMIKLVRNYLYLKGIADLFSVKIQTNQNNRLVAAIHFVYDDSNNRTERPGVE